jgi:hypothetical protein
MPTPPATITLTPASAPGAPSTITNSAASAPSAPSTIAHSAASAPSIPATISKAPANNVFATLTTAASGTNNDIKLTSKLPGTAGNSITFITGASSGVFVEVTGTNIVVQTDTAITTAAEVISALNANAAASLLVFAENAPGNDGTGVIMPAVGGTLSGGGTTALSTSTITLTAASQPAAPGIISP